MAEINPNIAMGYRPVEIQDPINQMAKYQDIAVNNLKMQEYQRGIAEQNALRSLRQSGVNPKSQEYVNKVYEISPELGAKYEKQQLETRKLGGEVTEQDLKVAREQYGNLAFNTSNENVIAHLQDGVLNGRISQDQAARQWQQISGMNPAQRKQYFEGLAQTANQRLTLEETKRTHKVHEGIAGGQLAVAQQRLEWEKTKPVYSEATGGFVVPPKPGQTEAKIIPIGNVEDTKKGREQLAGKTNVADIATTMAKSYDNLFKAGAMKSATAGAGSNAAAGLQSSGVGQLLGGAFGTAEQQERDFIKSQRPLLVQSIVKATGMTASQINSNAELKNLLDAATDPSKGYETNIRTLNLLNKRYGTGSDVFTLPGTNPTTNPTPTGGVNQVSLPDGRVMSFPTPEAAQAFKKSAGL